MEGVFWLAGAINPMAGDAPEGCVGSVLAFDSLEAAVAHTGDAALVWPVRYATRYVARTAAEVAALDDDGEGGE